MSKPEIKNRTMAELKQELTELGEKPFRAQQVFRWLHLGVSDFEEMTNLSKQLRETLREHYLLTAPNIVRKQVSAVDGTIKYLWELHDGNCVESVFMRYKHGNSACVSSQVGCRMGCKFCASGIGGLVRSLSAGEILDQILFMQKDTGERISNIVLMGTGEPLDNYDNVLRFIHLVGAPEGLNIGQRHISLSTSGLADQIDRLAQEKLQITLSVSLHSPDNESRSSMMPVNRSYPVERLLESCRNYFDITGRRISYEYTMIDGVSDHPWQARKLASLLRGRPAHVNLIPLNTVTESGLKPSSRASVSGFQKILESNGITATVRRTLGPDIDASCGQLRRRHITQTFGKE
ncbi:MAG: 23S rRNA (adenine(2503)-C(2))-methyltransferase RlmN [Butyricicoccus sp.]